MTISINPHKDLNQNSEKEFETWKETIERFREHINSLEQESILLLQRYGLSTDRRIINTNSTGKDSMVMLTLAEKSSLNFKTYFNVTTLDVGESNRMAKQLGFEFTYPKKPYDSFYKYVEQYNIVPSRLNRFCCEKFKETATMDEFNENEKLLFLFGMRNSESTARSGYTDVWVNEKWQERDWIGILPIRKWTDLDIWLYTLRENIPINQKYRMGYARVGCAIACPNYGKSTWVLDKYWYPNMFNRWRTILRKDFVTNNKWIVMNCCIEDYCNKFWTGGVASSQPSEITIREYAEYNNMDSDVAKKYFNRYCMNGCQRKGKLLKIKDKQVLGMNMKYFGRNVEKFKCKKCLMKEFEWSKEDWDNQVQNFKLQGCVLF